MVITACGLTQALTPRFNLFSDALCISFSRCSSLDVRLFTYASSWSLLRSSRRILPTLASFLNFSYFFLDSLYAFYFLLFLIALSISFQSIFTQNPVSTNLNYNCQGARPNKNWFRSTHPTEKVWQLILIDQYLLFKIRYYVVPNCGTANEINGA